MKRICSSIVVLSMILLVASCHNGQQPTIAAPSTDTTTMNMNKYTLDMVDNKKDLNCGMPLSAGIGDTAHYQGKVYGFCSTECKDAFLAKPDSFLQANKQ
jgi:YHS domain-containing protein